MQAFVGFSRRKTVETIGEGNDCKRGYISWDEFS